MVPGKIPEIPVWFPDARLNFAENLLYRRDDSTALTEVNETGVIAHVTFSQLHDRVRKMAAALLANGLTVGDRVAGLHQFLLNNTSSLLTCKISCHHQFHQCSRHCPCRCEYRRHLLQHGNRHGDSGKAYGHPFVVTQIRIILGYPR